MNSRPLLIVVAVEANLGEGNAEIGTRITRRGGVRSAEASKEG